jgi:hypothetical protein
MTHVTFPAKEDTKDDPDSNNGNGSEHLGQIVLTIHKAKLFGPIPFYDPGGVQGGLKGWLSKGGKLRQDKEKLMPHTIRCVNYCISSVLT